MTKKMRRKLWKILIAAILFVIAAVDFCAQSWDVYIFFTAYLIVGWDIIKKSVKNILKGHVFDENFLMSIATIGAWILGEYSEAVAVMLFFQVGEFFQNSAVNKSRRAVAELMDIRPETANVYRKNKIVEVAPSDVQVGEKILIRPGEKIPLDAVVINGEAAIDTSALTGEPLPKDVSVGDNIVSGCVNLSGLLKAKVTSSYGESTISKILDLVENASLKKTEVESFISRFARYYTPAVVIGALVVALFPWCLGWGDFSTWSYRALTFLVISCPCALVISVPLSFFGGIAAASKNGILVKGSCFLEIISKVKIGVFDKTGTLTQGDFKVKKIKAVSFSEKKLLEYVAYAEANSAHPLAKVILAAYGKKINISKIDKHEEVSGKGICAIVEGKQIIVGNQLQMDSYKIIHPKIYSDGTIFYVAINGIYAGYIEITDRLRKEAKETVAMLRKSSVRKFIMLSGDRSQSVAKIARDLKIKEFYADLLPSDKVKILEKIMTDNYGEKVLFVGDGVNDAPVLARADVGIALGGIASDAAIEAADVVIMTDDLKKIIDIRYIAKKTQMIVWQNIVFAIGVKIGVLALGALGFVSMWAAIFADVGVSVIAILNAIRTLFIRVR